MYTTKSTGPKIDPCGTPLVTGKFADAVAQILTNWLLKDRKSLIHFHGCSVIPRASTFRRSLLCGTVSNAFCISKYRTSIVSPISNASVHFSVVML